MGVPLIISGVTYDYPTTGSELWGTEATDWSIAVTDALEILVVEGDLGPTILISLDNNQAAPVNIQDLQFDSATVRSANVDYYVYVTYNSGSQELAESGTMYITYLDVANIWRLAKVGDNVGYTGVDFDITSAGQVVYTSTNLTPATGYSASMKFRAKVLNKT